MKDRAILDPLDLHFRLFESADQEAAQKLILAGLGEHFGSIDPSLNPDLHDIDASYRKAGHIFVVVEAAGCLVGTGGLVLESATVGRIVRVSVERSHRGIGVGRAIVDHLVDVARDRQLRQVLVETNADWFAAAALYGRCGFVEYARDAESVHFHLEL